MSRVCFFEGRKSCRVSNVTGEVVSNVRTEVREKAKAKRRSLNIRVCDEERREREGLYSCSSSER